MSMDVASETIKLPSSMQKRKVKRKLMIDKDRKSAWINESLSIMNYVLKVGMPI